MISVRQAQALVWIAQLGTFERAAAQLGTTQSAISKRIRELEAEAGVTLFDRGGRGARLTPQGVEVLEIARRIVQLAEEVSAFRRDAAVALPPRRLRVGVTELTAMTWLPALVAEIRSLAPGIAIETEVANAKPLYARVREGLLDLAVGADIVVDPTLRAVLLAEVRFDWMAAPGLIAPGCVLEARQLMSYPLMLQGGYSGAGSYIDGWCRSAGSEMGEALSLDSLMAIVGMTAAGMGISHLPYDCCRHLVDSGRLQIVQTVPPVPSIPYVAMFRADHPSKFIAHVAARMVSICDFKDPVWFADGVLHF